MELNKILRAYTFKSHPGETFYRKEDVAALIEKLIPKTEKRIIIMENDKPECAEAQIIPETKNLAKAKKILEAAIDRVAKLGVGISYEIDRSKLVLHDSRLVVHSAGEFYDHKADRAKYYIPQEEVTVVADRRIHCYGEGDKGFVGFPFK